jgi:hypothetical protein
MHDWGIFGHLGKRWERERDLLEERGLMIIAMCGKGGGVLAQGGVDEKRVEVDGGYISCLCFIRGKRRFTRKWPGGNTVICFVLNSIHFFYWQREACRGL